VNRVASPLQRINDIARKTGGITSIPTPKPNLLPAITILPEVNLLAAAEEQSFWVAIEVAAVTDRPYPLDDSSLDIIFVIDNAYNHRLMCRRDTD
jgi:hypothetical protein